MTFLALFHNHPKTRIANSPSKSLRHPKCATINTTGIDSCGKRINVCAIFTETKTAYYEAYQMNPLKSGSTQTFDKLFYHWYLYLHMFRSNFNQVSNWHASFKAEFNQIPKIAFSMSHYVFMLATFLRSNKSFFQYVECHSLSFNSLTS